MNFFTSFFRISNIDNIQQRKFILNVCSQILSIPFAQVNSNPLKNNDYKNNNIDKLLKEVFLSNNIIITNDHNPDNLQQKQLQIDYKDETLKNVIILRYQRKKRMVSKL